MQCVSCKIPVSKFSTVVAIVRPAAGHAGVCCIAQSVALAHGCPGDSEIG